MLEHEPVNKDLATMYESDFNVIIQIRNKKMRQIKFSFWCYFQYMDTINIFRLLTTLIYKLKSLLTYSNEVLLY